MKGSTFLNFVHHPSEYIKYLRKHIFTKLQNELWTKLIRNKNDDSRVHCWECGAEFAANFKYTVCIGLDPETEYNEPMYDSFMPRFCPHCGKKFHNIEEIDKSIEYCFPADFGFN